MAHLCEDLSLIEEIQQLGDDLDTDQRLKTSQRLFNVMMLVKKAYDIFSTFGSLEGQLRQI